MGLGVKNQLILVKTIDFSLLVPQKLAIESSINNNVYYQKKVSKLPTYKIHLTMEIISYISGLNGVRVKQKFPILKGKYSKLFDFWGSSLDSSLGRGGDKIFT